MTKRKENPLPRAECARRAGLASAKSPNRYTPFAGYGDDTHEAISRKGGQTTAVRYPGRMRELARLGGLAPRKRRRTAWRHL